jgi:uncharacterized protein YegJ (DUF2314 family)
MGTSINLSIGVHAMRWFTASALLAVVAVSASAATVEDRVSRDELAYMPDADPAMQRAFARARAELDDFLGKAKSPPPDTFGFSVKVAIRDRGKTEYFWVGPFTELDGGRFTGRIDNEPRAVANVRLGQTYAFAKSEIVDWTYMNRAQRKVYGNYTMCALLTKEPPHEAEAVRKRYGLDCG